MIHRTHVASWLGGCLGVFTLGCLLACIEGGASSGERRAGDSTNVDTRTETRFEDGGVLVTINDAGTATRVFNEDGSFNPAAASTGALAVDDRDETTYVLQTFPTTTSTRGGVRTVWAVPPGAGTVRELARVDDLSELRMVFPEPGVVLLGERQRCASDHCEQLRLFARGSMQELRRRDVSMAFSTPHLSPSRRWLTVDDNQTRLFLVDPRTLDTQSISPDGDNVTAAWFHQRDSLVVVTTVHDSSPLRSQVRVIDLPVTATFGLPLPERVWSNPSIDITLPTDGFLDVLTGTPVVSPDDRYAAIAASEAVHQVALLDLRRSQVRYVQDLRGPVGFTPDGTAMVALSTVAGTPPVVVIDTETLARTEVASPFDLGGSPSFFVSRTGHQVVIAPMGPRNGLLLYDLTMHQSTRLESTVSLNEFVSRPRANELWIADVGLARLDFNRGTIETVSIGWLPGRINYLPVQDQLVLDRPRENGLSFWSPETRSLVRTVSLPVPGIR